MNGSFATSQSVGPNAVLVTQSIVHVEQEDGRTAEIKGEYDIIVTTEGGKQVRFSHPIIVESLPDGYLLKGSNRSPKTFKESEMKKVEVVKFDAAKTTLGLALVGAILAVGVAALVSSH